MGEQKAWRFDFPYAGDFRSVYAAEDFLAKAGFSVGRTQRGSPRGILFGAFDIQKWRNLRPADRKSLHGEMIGGRDSCVRIVIRADAPPEAHEALRIASLQPKDTPDV